MKIQLYATPAISGAYSILRYRDGVYDRIPNDAGDCENTPGLPVDQAWARSIRKSALVMDANRGWYGISKDTELYKEESV